MLSDTAIIPADVRQRLEKARLDNLALMRALDRVYRDGPPIAEAILRAWYELEADCVEGLWVPGCNLMGPARCRVMGPGGGRRDRS